MHPVRLLQCPAERIGVICLKVQEKQQSSSQQLDVELGGPLSLVFSSGFGFPLSLAVCCVRRPGPERLEKLIYCALLCPDSVIPELSALP